LYLTNKEREADMRNNKNWLTLFLCILTGMVVNVSAQTWTSQTLPSTQTLRAVHFINSNEGWAAGYDGIIHTINSGSTWTSQITGFPYRLLSVRFVNASYGWANAGLKILRTENGGASWRDMTGIDPNAIIFRNKLFPVSSTVAWATAQGGGTRWFYRYTATSASAVTEQTFGLIGSSAVLYDLWFADQNTGWAVGLGGQIWKITDASTDAPAFTNQSNSGATSQTLWGVFFLDLNNGWAVGNGGAIIKTSDGGTNWSAITSGTTVNLKDVHFIDINHGYVVGESGLIRVTTDGGVNWSTQTSGVTTTLWSIDFYGSAPGFIAGGDLSTSIDGTMLRTDNAVNVETDREHPTGITLFQNFPNPFRQTTEISFYINNKDIVSLKVYDITGRKVADMLSEELQPGQYTKTLNASGLQEGMYFYRLQAGKFYQTRKLVLKK
jgi:photosystem II stability/assembly factor-like uncharacterized protein